MVNEILSTATSTSSFPRILEEEQRSWLDDYSLKFLGCDASSNRARFRLCPQGACWNRDWLGCRENYGDYAIDMDSYVQALMILWNGVTFNTCNQTAYEECGSCYTMSYGDGDGDEADSEEGDGEDDGEGDDNIYGYANSDECLYTCLHNNTVMPSCYYVLTEEDYFVERYSCGQLDNSEYYLGPYCGEDGSGIYIGLFEDGDCSEMVEDGSAGGADTWIDLEGDQVAFTETSGQSLQFTDCLRCVALDNDNAAAADDDGDGYGNHDGTTCDQLYQDESLLACETYLSSEYQRDNNEYSFYDEGYNEECYEIDQIPLPKQQDDHSSFYYFRHFALPILIALGLLIASQRRNQYDRAQFEDKKEALVGVHGEQELPQGVMS
jgi:hypothetical protein